MAYSNFFKGLSAALAALVLVCSCNKDNSTSSQDFSAPRRVAVSLSDVSLSTRSLSSDFDLSGTIKYLIGSVSSSADLKGKSLKSSDINITEGVISTSDLWLKKGESLGGAIVSDQLYYGISDKVLIEPNNQVIDYSEQLWYTDPCFCSYDNPTFSAELIPALNLYTIDNVQFTCDNPLYSVVTTWKVDFTYPTYWNITRSSESVYKFAVNSCTSYQSLSDMLKWDDNCGGFTTSSQLTSSTLPAYYPAVRSANLYLTVSVYDGSTLVSSSSDTLTLDLSAYNQPLTAYHFTLKGKVNAGGGPLSFNLSAKALSVVNKTIEVDEVSID